MCFSKADQFHLYNVLEIGSWSQYVADQEVEPWYKVPSRTRASLFMLDGLSCQSWLFASIYVFNEVITMEWLKKNQCMRKKNGTTCKF